MLHLCAWEFVSCTVLVVHLAPYFRRGPLSPPPPQWRRTLSTRQIFGRPGNDSPVVAELARCQCEHQWLPHDYSWCDVDWAPISQSHSRGILTYPCRNGRVPSLREWPPSLSPRVTFSLRDCWIGLKAKPFYEQRSQWHSAQVRRATTELTRATTENRSNVNRSNVTRLTDQVARRLPANEESRRGGSGGGSWQHDPGGRSRRKAAPADGSPQGGSGDRSAAEQLRRTWRGRSANGQACVRRRRRNRTAASGTKSSWVRRARGTMEDVSSCLDR